jgi:hypothetical protein
MKKMYASMPLFVLSTFLFAQSEQTQAQTNSKLLGFETVSRTEAPEPERPSCEPSGLNITFTFVAPQYYAKFSIGLIRGIANDRSAIIARGYGDVDNEQPATESAPPLSGSAYGMPRLDSPATYLGRFNTELDNPATTLSRLLNIGMRICGRFANGATGGGNNKADVTDEVLPKLVGINIMGIDINRLSDLSFESEISRVNLWRRRRD